MDIFLWVLAFLLAAVFVGSGAAKLITPRERQIERTPYVEDFPHSIIRGIGVIEILGAIGLIVPAVTGIAPILVSLAAAGLAITMVFAALVHTRRGDPFRSALPSIVLALGSVLLAWSRFGPYAL